MNSRPSDVTDEELLDAYHGGEEDAFRLFHARHAARVRAYARKKGFAGAQADDIVQEVFLRLHRNIDRYERGRPAMPWFFALTRNVVFDALRKKGHRTFVSWDESIEGGPPARDGALAAPPDPSAPFFPSAPSVPDGHPKDEALAHARERLSPQQREVLDMRIVDERSFKEISDRTGRSEVSLRKAYSRALALLRAFLKEER